MLSGIAFTIIAPVTLHERYEARIIVLDTPRRTKCAHITFAYSWIINSEESISIDVEYSFILLVRCVMCT